MKKLMILPLFTVLLLFVFPLQSFALSDDFTAQTNSLSSFEDQFLQIENEVSLSDSEKLQALTELLFLVKAESVLHPEESDFDFSLFWNCDSTHYDNLSYFARSIAAQKYRYPTLGAVLYVYESEIVFNNVAIDGDKAQVQCIEIAHHRSSFDDEAGTKCIPESDIVHKINFVSIGGQWLIDDIEFLDESSVSLRNPNLTLDEYLERLKDSFYLTPEEGESGETAEVPACDYPRSEAYSYLSLTSSRVKSYAETYASSGSYNSLFPVYSGNDCQNFASQCVWYGLGGTNSSSSINNKYIPMVGSGSRAWYQTGTLYDTPNTWVWVNCQNFSNYVTSGGSSVQGPTGTAYSGIAYAQVGDIIQYGYSSAGYSHSYVVTAVSGTYGNRTANNITICAHTNDRNSVNLGSLYDGGLVYHTIHVSGAYYEN